MYIIILEVISNTIYLLLLITLIKVLFLELLYNDYKNYGFNSFEDDYALSSGKQITGHSISERKQALSMEL